MLHTTTVLKAEMLIEESVGGDIVCTRNTENKRIGRNTGNQRIGRNKRIGRYKGIGRNMGNKGIGRNTGKQKNRKKLRNRKKHRKQMDLSLIHISEPTRHA